MAAFPAGNEPSLSLRNGFRCVPEAGNATAIEEVLLATGEQVGHENIVSASRMNKAVVVFLKNEQLVTKVIESGIWVKETYVPVSPLFAPATKVTISNVPPFIKDDAIVRELTGFGKMASAVKTIHLGCKSAELKHVLSFRRQAFMVLTAPSKTLDVSFRVTCGESSYMVYASTDTLRCFECGDIGHKRLSCPHKQLAEEEAGKSGLAGASSGATAVGKSLSDTSARKEDGETKGVNVTSDSGVEVSVNASGNTEGTNVEVSASGGTGICVLSCKDDRMNNDIADSNDEAEKESEDESRDDDDSCIDVDIGRYGDFYSVEQINSFLDETKGRSVNVEEFFPDLEKFIASVGS